MRSNREKLNEDMELLKRAVDLALEGIKKGGGPFGAVIARNGQIVSEAYNEVILESDPTAHAEILAIRRASISSGTHNLNDCTLYASCEPCPMCLGAVYWSGIQRIFYASSRKDAATAGFGDDYFYEEFRKDPEHRDIICVSLPGIDGSVAFREWERLENKISY